MELDPNKMGTYKIEFPGGEFYFGSGTGVGGIISRWNKHKNGWSVSPYYLQEMAQKYGGWTNEQIKFIILENTETRLEALQLEEKHIREYWSDPLLLNKSRNVLVFNDDISGENHSMWGKHHTEESKQKIREHRKDTSGENNSFFGKHHTEATKQKFSEMRSNGKSPSCGMKRTEEHKQKISKANKGKITSKETKEKISNSLKGRFVGENSPNFGREFTEEHKQKISKSRTGMKLTEEHKQNIGKAGRGRKHTEETKQKISNGNKGKVVSQETRKKMSENHADCSGENCGNAKLTWKKVAEIREKYSTGDYSYRKLAREYDVNKSTIKNIIRNKTWKIKDSYEDKSKD